MAVSEQVSTGLAAVAWFVAAALAAGAGGVAFGLAAHRRGRQAEQRLRHLERAVAEFCSALRDRVAVERDRGLPPARAAERAGATREEVV